MAGPRSMRCVVPTSKYKGVSGMGLRKHAATRVVVGMAVMSVGMASLTTPAFADASDDSVEQILENVPSKYEVLEDAASSTQTDDFTIAQDPSDGVTLEDEDGNALSVKLPFADQAADAVPVDDSTVAYDNANDTTTVPTGKADGSVQINTILESVAAPETFEYVVSADNLAHIDINDDGSAAFLASDGSFLGGAASPWAVDANGVAVPTHFEVAGNTLIQVVDHVGAGYQYPIVADPWLGANLYGNPWITYYSWGYKINVQPTDWGKVNTGGATWWAHRDEVRNKLGGNSWRWTNSIQEQFYCHIAGVPASLPTYNLESNRVDWNWTLIAPYKCNYPEGWFSG